MCRQYLGQPHQHTVLIKVTPILQGLLVDGQPHQRGGTAVIGDQRQHDGGLVIGIEVGPIHCHDDGRAGADDVRHPQGQDVIDIDAIVGQQPVYLFDRMLGRQAARRGQSVPDGGDHERGAVQHADRGIAQAVDTFGMQIMFEYVAEHAMHRVI